MWAASSSARRVSDEDDLVDRLVDDLLEAGHVDAGLARVEVDEAGELGEVEAAARRG